MTVGALTRLLEDLGERVSEGYYGTHDGQLALSNIIATIDADKSGEVDFCEFMPWWREYSIRKIFLLYDRDGDGTISRAEIHPLLRRLGSQLQPEELTMMLQV
jgi:Ca2+-binding EF-hand superfamily protein